MQVSGEDEGIRVVIRQIIDVEKSEPFLIEHNDGCDEA